MMAEVVPPVSLETLTNASESSTSRIVVAGFIAWFTILICAAIYVVVFIVVPDLSPEVVRTSYGEVRGVRSIKFNKVVHSFLGIPYAAPPIGSLRFRKPESAQKWANIYDADKQSLACPQYVPRNSAIFKQAAESEDCLYLNVYTPGHIKRNSKKTVMVYFHGGSFLRGKISDYDASTLSAYGDVVVVVVAYRLGIFGFMFDNSTELPGNVGLLDQVHALQWVKENIGAFGGDPESITLFGNSAGGISIGYHIISPLSRHLFKRAIMQSGSVLTPVMLYGTDTGPVKVEMVANKTGCPYVPRQNGSKYATFTSETYNCLRSLKTDQLLEAQASIVGRMRDTGFFPVVDGYFLEEHPFDVLGNGYTFNSTHEILMGSNANEGALFMSLKMPDLFPSSANIAKNLSLKQITKRFRKYGKKSLKILEFFRINEDMKAENLTNRLDQVVGEILFLCPDIYFVNVYTQNVGKKLYYYVFRPRPDIAKNFRWAKGAIHSEELQFLFGRPFEQLDDYSAEERELSRAIMRDWTHFAKHGYVIAVGLGY